MPIRRFAFETLVTKIVIRRIFFSSLLETFEIDMQPVEDVV
jgi:hypothetical protein